MADPLDGCRRKLIRADAHLDELERRVIAWVEGDPYDFVQSVELIPDGDVELTAHVLRSRVTEPYDDEWPLIVGEAMCQARSALDHLIQQLVLANAKRPTGSHQFPIAKAEATFKSRKISGIAPRWKAQIRSLQPYNRSPPEASPLFRLNALAQTDKHREILMTAMALHPPAPEFFFDVAIAPSVEGRFDLRTLHVNWLGQPVDGALIHGVITDPFDPEMHLQISGRFPLTVAFGEGQETIGDLRGLISIVREVITSFEPAFG